MPGEAVYGEKRISVESEQEGEKKKVEYRVWNPFRSKLAAGILGGLDNIYIAPGKKVLYLGAASGTSVSHVADVVGPEGAVYAVEFSHRSGRDLINMAKKRTNVIRRPLFFFRDRCDCEFLTFFWANLKQLSKTPDTLKSTEC